MAFIFFYSTHRKHMGMDTWVRVSKESRMSLLSQSARMRDPQEAQQTLAP